MRQKNVYHLLLFWQHACQIAGPGLPKHVFKLECHISKTFESLVSHIPTFGNPSTGFPRSGSNVRCSSFFTCKCASHHNGVHFFDIASFKIVPKLTCFVHFDLEMCFAPQRPALFRHLNFQKWSDHDVFCTFSLRNLLRTTTACNFSSLIWPAGSAPAALASLLFRPSGATNHWNKSLEKHSVSRLSYLFAQLDLLSSGAFSFLIFFLLLLSSLTLPTSAFHLFILSEVWLLNFLR